MLTLHAIDDPADLYGPGGLYRTSPLSVGLIDPHPPGKRIRVYDFGTGNVRDIAHDGIVAVVDPPALSFASRPFVGLEGLRDLAANRPKKTRGRVVRLKRKRAPVPDTFVSGYEHYARDAALFWRDQGVGTQPLLAAGVFALSSVQVPIVTALRLFRELMPYVVNDVLPSATEISAIVRRAGAGLDNPFTGRPRWYVEYERFRWAVQSAIATGWRDDELRASLAKEVGLPLGLGLAKLSFTLALVGNNLGCIDARIIDWAFTKHAGEAWLKTVSRKRRGARRGTVTDHAYAAYRKAERTILENTPFYDPRDPVALSRAQWKLWESLGPEQDRTHTHEELFEAVQDERLLAALGDRA